MRVLQTHNYYQQSGGEDHVYAEESELLAEKGHFVHKHSVHNDDVSQHGKIDLLRRTYWNQDSYDEIAEIIKENKIDVLHSHNTLPLLSPSIYYAARDNGAAVVQTLHNYRLYCPGALFYRDGKVCEDCLGKKFALPGVRHACYRGSRVTTGVVAGMVSSHRKKGTWENEVDAYISLTRFAKSRFVQGGLSSDKIYVKPNFVGTDHGMGSGSGDYCLFVGRLSEEKGIESLLDAWEDEQLTLPLWIAGTGPLTDMVKDRASRNSKIVYKGFVSSDDVKKYMSEAMATLVSSVWYETFGRVVVESFSVGTPVIASNIGALSELLNHGETGYLYKPGDVEDLKKKIRLLSNLSSRELSEMRKQARLTYEENYTPEINYGQLIQVYEAAIENLSTSPPQRKA